MDNYNDNHNENSIEPITPDPVNPATTQTPAPETAPVQSYQAAAEATPVQNYQAAAEAAPVQSYQAAAEAAPVQNYQTATEATPVQNYQAAPADDRYSSYIDNSQQPGNSFATGHAYSASQATAGNSNETNSPYTVYGNAYPGGYTYPTNSPTGYHYVTEPVKEPKKRKRMPAFLRVLLSAILFGVIASAVFIGTNELYYKLFPSSVSSTSDDANASHSTATSTAKDTSDSAKLVESTALLSNVDTTPTDVTAVVENCMPSIVSISCTFNATSFFGTYETSGAGSGIILQQTASELMIATNNHVVANATSINVTFCDGTTATAITKGTDATADLAVISIDIESLSAETLSVIKVATVGDSNEVKVGQMVVAIGNAMGYGQSTTVGYVSAKDREVTVDNKVMTLLQTDAAINPGNSGGALLNLKGELIGINSVKYADTDVEGMGFAIPISRAIDILNELSSREILKDSEKGYLGVYMQDVTSAMASAYNIPIGVYISQIVEGSPAEAAGLQAGDIVTGANGVSVSTATDLKNAITSYKYGTSITLTFERILDGQYKEMTLEIILGKNPDYNE